MANVEMQQPVNEIEAVIFDLDGTLLDTEELSTQSINAVLAQFQEYRFDWQLKKRILGMRGADWSLLVVNELEMRGKLTPEELVIQWERELHSRCSQIRAMPGAMQLLHELGLQKNVPLMAIATSSNSASVALKSSSHGEMFGRMNLVGEWVGW
jgi:beta-phosphoglucomutase-like phosphatase (HAD superfamily)